MAKKNIKQTFPVEGMSCAACASSVESILGQLDGIKEVSVNFASNSVQITHLPQVTFPKMQEALQPMGFHLIQEEESIEVQQEKQLKRLHKIRNKTIGSALLTFPVFVIGMFFMDWVPGRWISLVLSSGVLFYFGQHFFVNAFQQARHAKANMDTLVALSTGIAFLFSLFNTVYPEFWTNQGKVAHVYYEAATVIITFISLGKWLEEKAKSNTSTAIQKLIGLQAKTARIIVDGQEKEIAIESLKKGDRILVKPGEKIPVDGTVAKGHSYVDESMMNGEPVPIEKMENSRLMAGTLNQNGSLEFVAEKVGKETLLAQIIEKVKEAQGSKSPVQKTVDKIAGIFVPTIIGISIITFIIWFFAGGENGFSQALLTSITVLIIACPCALGLATPTAIMVGMGKGAENHILIKDAESLERIHEVDTIVLDKTGTITKGNPTVQEFLWGDGIETAYHVSILFAMESKSEHPLAQAIVKDLSAKNLKIAELNGFKNHTGKGLEAKIANGEQYFVGTPLWMKQMNIQLPEKFGETVQNWQKKAQTIVFFANKEQVLAIIGISDPIKDEAQEAFELLRKKNIDLHILSGDNEHTVKAVAEECNIPHYKAAVLPSDKSDYIQNLQDQGKTVAMIGDGINDSQALAKADISIAMGKGSDIAMETAQMTLMTSNLKTISKAIKLSSATVKGVKQNLFWAFLYNLIGIPIAAGIFYPINGFLLDPMIAGAAMAFSSVSVVLNSLRLKTIKL